MISTALFYLAKSIGNKILNLTMPDASIFIGAGLLNISGSNPGKKRPGRASVTGSAWLVEKIPKPLLSRHLS
jgi:hypothetical protein